MESSHANAVHCPACSRLVKVPEDAQAGLEISCPFCSTAMQLKEVTVLMAQATDTNQDSG